MYLTLEGALIALAVGALVLLMHAVALLFTALRQMGPLNQEYPSLPPAMDRVTAPPSTLRRRAADRLTRV